MEEKSEVSDLQKVFRLLQAAEAKLEKLHDPIAIVGMSCRFPGDAHDPEQFWRLLENGFDGVREVPKDRWDVNSYYDPDPKTPNKMYTKWGGFLNFPIENFDAHFFNISPREAVAMDPQQRLVLEVAWEALENGGIHPQKLKGTSTGVFIGICSNDYLQLLSKESIDAYLGTGNAFSVVSGRLSYQLGLKGPALSIDTACSSSLVALHTACVSLRLGECTTAIVGGVNVILNPALTITFCKAGMLSPEGHCKTFDASADGFVRGEGCGVVILKRLTDAKRDNNRILAIIDGSGINQDGEGAGLTVPNQNAQEALLHKVLSQTNLKPNMIDYFEVHGTGTPLGDPIEVKSIESVYQSSHLPQNSLWLGTVKTNIGHLEGAAGIAGLIKVILSLEHEVIPPNLHFQKLNPYISLDDISAAIPLKLVPWKRSGKVRRAGINSFGFSGTNAHAIIEEAPLIVPSNNLMQRPYHLIVLSAKTDKALDELIKKYELHLKNHPDQSLLDLAYTANTGRVQFDANAVIMAQNSQELLSKLQKGDYRRGKISNKKPKLALVLSNQEAFNSKIYATLNATHPTFKKNVEELSSAFSERIKTALTMLWKSWGIIPDTIISQDSLDEIQKLKAEGWHLVTMNAVEEDVWKTLLENLTQLYFQGFPIDWEGFDAPYHPIKIALPTYPFQRQRYWAISVPSPFKRTGVELHPLLGEYIQSPLEDLLFRKELDFQEFPYLKDHQIYQHVLFSGTGFFELALAAGRHLFKEGNLFLENFQIQSPLELSEEKKTLLQVIAHREEGKYIFSIYSLNPQDEDNQWTLHATAKGSISLENPPNRVKENLPTFTHELNIAEFYKNLASKGFNYGPFFQRVKKLWVEKNEVLAELEPLEEQGYFAHPALLDGCIQALIAATLDEKNIYLPIGFDQMILYSPLESSLQAYARIVSESDQILKGDIILFTSEGKVLAEIRGFQAKKTTPALLNNSLKKQIQLTYELSWQPSPLEEIIPVEKPSGTWLIFANEQGLGASLNKQLKTIGDSSLLVSSPPKNMEQMLQLLQETLKEGPIAGIFYFPDPVIEEFKKAISSNLETALALAQAIITLDLKDSLLFYMITQKTLSQAPLSGFLYSWILEYPHMKICELTFDSEMSLQEQMGSLLNEINVPSNEDRILYSKGVRHVPRLIRSSFEEVSEMPVHSDASYLIAGGLGGIGGKIAEWLSVRGAKHIVLFSRNLPKEKTRELIKKIESQGTHLEVLSLDITRTASVEFLMQKFGQEWPELKGIFHLSGVLDDGSLLNQNATRFENVLAPKIEGAWNLHTFSLNKKLDFFVLFSSIASIFGSPGQSNYAAANAFLDTLAQTRSQKGLPALSISWGPWSEVGMAVNIIEQQRQKGFLPLTPEEGIHALEMALGKKSPHILIAKIDWKTVALKQAKLTSLFKELLPLSQKPAESQILLKQLQKVEAKEKESILRDHILSLVRKVLGWSFEEEIPEENSLMDMGMDSIMATELNNHLKSLIGTLHPISATFIFDHPSISQIMDFFKKEIFPLLDKIVIPEEKEEAKVKIQTEEYGFSHYPEMNELEARNQLFNKLRISSPYFREDEGITNNHTLLNGKEYINFSTYNYLGLSGHPEVSKAVSEAVMKYGSSISSSRVISSKPIHRQLEKEIADFLGTESAVVFVGGHATNETTIGHLFKAQDLIVCDTLDHNSIIQGALLSGAKIIPFLHNDMQSLEHQLKENRNAYRRCLIVAEGVYSMEGDICDLKSLVELKKKYQTYLMIDEAHSMGILGPTGRGVSEYFGIPASEVDIWMGTLSKTFGSCGGYIAGTSILTTYLKFTTPGFVFAAGISPSNCAAALAALRIIKREPSRVKRLQDRAKFFCELVHREGFNTGLSRDSGVIPIIVGDTEKCYLLSDYLFEKGINAHPITYPAVPQGTDRLRFFLSSEHTEAELQQTVLALIEGRNRLKF